MDDHTEQMTDDHVEPLDLAPLQDLIARHRVTGSGALIPVLQEAQAHYGYLPEAVVAEVARANSFAFNPPVKSTIHFSFALSPHT